MEGYRIQSLEMTYFKSFIHLLLKDGTACSFYAIVGMNGSGKSNLVDAFLYVLGENRPGNLRARHLSDLIYTAADTQPVQCLVKLTFLKDSITTVFERSTTRNSVSTYKHNDAIMSYHEYTEALRSIGVCVNMQNFFILQGHVQDVAGMSNKNMSGFLERISGSLLYKKDHEDAQKRRTEALRILTEKRKMKAHYLNKIHQAKLEIESTRKIHQIEQDLKEQRVLLALFKEKQYSHALDDYHQQIDVKTRQLDNLHKKKENLLKNVQDLKRNAQDTEEIAKITEEITALEQELPTLSAEFSRITTLLEVKTNQINANANQLNILQSELDKNTTSSALNQSTMDSLLEQIPKEEEELNNMEPPSENVRKEYQKIKNKEKKETSRPEELRRVELSFLNVKLTHLKKKMEGVQEELNIKQSSLTRADAFCARYQELLVAAETEVTSLDKEINTLAAYPKVMRAWHAKLIKTQETIMNMENYLYHKNKTTENECDEMLCQKFRGLIGRVETLLPKKGSFKTTVAGVMFNHLQDFVADMMETAMRCGQMLNFTRPEDPPTGFLIQPVEEVRQRGINISGSQLVSDVLRSPELSRVVIDQGLDAILVDDVDEARVVAGEIGKDVNAAAKTGRVYHADGSFDINIPLPKGLKCTEGRLEEIINQLNNIVTEFGDNVALFSDMDEVCEKKSRRLHAYRNTVMNREKVDRWKKSQADLIKKTSEAQERLKMKEDEIKVVEDKIKKLSISTISPSVESQRFCNQHGYESVERFEAIVSGTYKTEKLKDIFMMKAQVEKCQALLIKYTAEKETVTRNMTDLKTTNADLEREQTALLAELQRVTEMVETCRTNLQTKLTKKTELLQSFDLHQHLGTLHGALKEVSDEMLKIEDERESAKQTVNAVNAERDGQRQYCNKNNIILPLLNDSNAAASSSATTGTQLDFSLLPRRLQRRVTPEESATIKLNFDDQIQALIKRRGELGQVYDDAEAVRERNRIEYQRVLEEFKESITALNDIEAEVDRLHALRAGKLHACLAHLAATIDKTYKSLNKSQAAAAQILPIDPDAPYQHGISYMCSVPGKCFQKIADLSSGERSIAALTLCFALKEFQPAPLYLLDEIDARLDPKNVGRLADFLGNQRASAAQLTFVVTHKLEVAEKAGNAITIVDDEGNETGEVTGQKIIKLDLDKYY